MTGPGRSPTVQALVDGARRYGGDSSECFLEAMMRTDTAVRPSEMGPRLLAPALNGAVAGFVVAAAVGGFSGFAVWAGLVWGVVGFVAVGLGAVVASRVPWRVGRGWGRVAGGALTAALVAGVISWRLPADVLAPSLFFGGVAGLVVALRLRRGALMA